MELQVISTGSKGNAYVLRAGDSALLLDAGVPIKKIVRSVPDWKRLIGCLITHEHKDHARCQQDLQRMGVCLYTSEGTNRAIAHTDGLCWSRVLRAETSYGVKEWTVMPFDVQHDAGQPFGYLIRYNPTGETALYATDTYYLKNTFPGVHYWIVECSYMDELIDQQRDDGDITEAFRHRLKTSHMSLRRLLDTLKANDLSKTHAIVLVHLSDERSDEKAMVEAVRRETGIEDVYAAEDGMRIPLELCPF